MILLAVIPRILWRGIHWCRLKLFGFLWQGGQLSAPTVLVILLVSPLRAACTHYASPTGAGARDGSSPNNAFQIADFWPVAGPGKTLCLLDGTYRGDRSMVNPPDGLN